MAVKETAVNWLHGVHSLDHERDIVARRFIGRKGEATFFLVGTIDCILTFYYGGNDHEITRNAHKLGI